jgi:hypothetical protein
MLVSQKIEIYRAERIPARSAVMMMMMIIQEVR